MLRRVTNVKHNLASRLGFLGDPGRASPISARTGSRRERKSALPVRPLVGAGHMSFPFPLVTDKSPTPVTGAGLGGSRTRVLGSASFVAAFCRNRLRNLAYEEGLKIGLIASPFKAGNRVPRLTRNEVSLSVGAGYFKLAGLAL
jgi:hypothetical protein